MVSDEDVNKHFSNNKERENQDFQGICRKLRLKTGQFFSSVRAEQPSKVCSEEKLKIKVSDDFSLCQ